MLNIDNYREIRGTLTKKQKTLSGHYYFHITDESKTVRIAVGKGMFEMDGSYAVGKQMTVGYIGQKLINIRPGICDTEATEMEKHSLFSFLQDLEEKKIYYRLEKARESIMVQIAVPGQRWEVEFFEDGHIEVEKFISANEIFDEKELETLFRDFSD